VENILQRKEGKANKVRNLKGYNQGLEMQIKNAFERLKDALDREEKRGAHKRMAELMALRNPEYVKELEYQKFGYYL